MVETLFEKEDAVSSELCERYKSIVPDELIDIWKNYGFGSFLNGYLKVINPDEYQELVRVTYFRGNVSIPIFVTAFGDIITWEENRYIRVVKYKNGTFKGIAAGFEFFFIDLKDGLFDEIFEMSKYEVAVKTLGRVQFDECFGYVPLLGLGGKESVDNLKKVKIREHIELITQMVGKIGM